MAKCAKCPTSNKTVKKRNFKGKNLGKLCHACWCVARNALGDKRKKGRNGSR